MSRRLLVIAGVIIFALLFRLVSFWEVEVVSKPECRGFASLLVKQAGWVSTAPRYHLYSFYAVNIIQVFLPFCLLLLLNVGIIWRIRVALNVDGDAFQRHSIWQFHQKEKNLQAATRILVCVISSYLVFNTLNLTITCLEHLATDDFIADIHQFYTFCVDAVNILFVITSTTRFCMYLLCSEKMRDETVSLLLKIFGCGKKELQTNTIVALDQMQMFGRTSVANGYVATMCVDTAEAFV